jgi:hypothetical protein
VNAGRADDSRIECPCGSYFQVGHREALVPSLSSGNPSNDISGKAVG